MKRELGIARCGLACCLCSENVVCKGCKRDGFKELSWCKDAEWCEVRKCGIAKNISGCYECEPADCRKGLYAEKIKPRAFAEFARRYGLEELLDCLDRATLLVKEEDKKPVIVMIREDEMELRINTTLGSMDEVVAIRREGEDLNIGFNPKFLIDALRSIDEEEVTMYLVSPKAPCFIRDAEDMYCYLILPVNFITID